MQIEVAALVDGAGSGDVEDRSEGSGRNPLIPRSKHSVQCEAAPGDIGKQLVKLVIVRVHRNAVVGGGTVEFREEKLVLPMGIIEGAGKKQFQAIVKLFAVADAALVRAVTGRLACHAHIWQIPPPFCNDVDDPQEGAGDIQGRIRPSDDFDAVNQIDVNRELRSNQSPVVNVIVEPVAINQQCDACCCSVPEVQSPALPSSYNFGRN